MAGCLYTCSSSQSSCICSIFSRVRLTHSIATAIKPIKAFYGCKFTVGQTVGQLTLVNGVVCRHYAPGPTSDTLTVPVLPSSLHHRALLRNHDAPSAGHQGADKTLERLQQEAYWVGMSADVERYCRECTRCQQSKLPAPTRAPLTPIPIGQPWQMIGVDILEVPMS